MSEPTGEKEALRVGRHDVRHGESAPRRASGRSLEHKRDALSSLPGTQLGIVAADTTTAHDSAAAADSPSVSVVIPCYNEERFIGKVLDNLADQYERERYEIIIVDGMSVDKTRAVIEEFIARRPGVKVRVVDNPQKHIPTGLNLGIEAARGDIIVRMDAHSVPTPNYVRRCVELLAAAEWAVVGMPWRIRASSDTLAARAIALAVAHPFGIGDAKYRLSISTSQLVDTVPFGAFRKSLWRELEGFNEDLLANEDYDFHYRVRSRGGRILLDTEAHCEYFARATISELAAQYARYGNWKAQMIKLHPRSIRLRQLVAPAFVISLVVFGALSPWSTPARVALAAIMVAYALCSLVFASRLARKDGDLRLIPYLCLAFFTIHITWGSSFLRGLVRSRPNARAAQA